MVDLIISCSICQQTLSAVYAELDGTDGLRQGPDHTNGSVTKLWLTECAHITCGKHLEGGDKQMLIHLKASLSILKGNLQRPLVRYVLSRTETDRLKYYMQFEALLCSEKELKTWKDREGPIVACLATTESLRQALQSARDQISNLGGETLAIDNILHHAAGLRRPNDLPRSKPSSSTVDSSETLPGNKIPPAGSLLARGSAADLQIIRNNVLFQNEHNFPNTSHVTERDDRQPLKRKRPDTVDTSLSLQAHIPDPDLRPQRLVSRDIMPPPLRRSRGISSTKSGRPSPSHLHWSVGQNSSKPDDHNESLHHDEYGLPNTGLSKYTEASIVSQGQPYITFGTSAIAAPNIFGERKVDDRDLARGFRFPAPSRLESRPSTVSPYRLTLPPNTPSLFSRTTPYHVGMTANVRSSKPSILMDERLPSRTRGVHDNQLDNSHGFAASPYFSNRTLPANHAVPSPYVDRLSPSMNHSRSAIAASTASASWKHHSSLTAPFKQGQHQDQRPPSAREFHSRSGACRPRGCQEERTYQLPSMNGFSFTNQPHLGTANKGRSASATFVKRGRRAARR
ncbi:MAG: hypothetical protein Q9219_005800 [cf. Caloplaca sp. 3 TL-2023]